MQLSSWLGCAYRCHPVPSSKASSDWGQKELTFGKGGLWSSVCHFLSILGHEQAADLWSSSLLLLRQQSWERKETKNWCNFLINTSITDLAGNRLTRFPKRGPYGSQRAPVIHLSLPPECWDYKCVLPHLGLGTQLKSFTGSSFQTRERCKTERQISRREGEWWFWLWA